MLLHIKLRRDQTSDEMYKRTVFRFKDGGEIALDSYPLNDKDCSEPPILLLPGLGSTSIDSYIKIIAKDLHITTNSTVYVLNRRGYLIDLQKGSNPFMWTNIEDIDEISRYVCQKHKYRSIGLVGVSIGGNQLHYFLGKQMPEYVHAATTISAPFDLGVCAQKVGRNSIIQKAILNNFLELLRKKMHMDTISNFFERKNIQIDDVLAVKSITEFDEVVNVKVNHCRDLSDYYSNYSGNSHLNQIGIPLLCINSKSDLIVE